MEIYSALKGGFTTARHQLADAREQARLAAARREKSREDAQAEAVRVFAQLNAQLEEALDARAEREPKPDDPLTFGRCEAAANAPGFASYSPGPVPSPLGSTPKRLERLLKDAERFTRLLGESGTRSPP